MQQTAIKAAQWSEVSAVSSEGFILLNSSFKPLFLNQEAMQILTYSQKPETKNREGFLTSRIQSLFLSESAAVPAVVTAFQSGRRVYECRAYRVSAVAKGDSQASVAILLQRRSRGSPALCEVSEKFNLTTREQQVLQYLSHGLTTKEIATGMEISPNTVKAFVRMIMIKMGVSTRSGVVGKALGMGA